jgi:hypothetical protein
MICWFYIPYIEYEVPERGRKYLYIEADGETLNNGVNATYHKEVADKIQTAQGQEHHTP